MREEMVEPEHEDTAPLQVSATFGTISEYFFLTLRILHIGLLSSFAMMEKLMQQHGRLQQVPHSSSEEVFLACLNVACVSTMGYRSFRCEKRSLHDNVESGTEVSAYNSWKQRLRASRSTLMA